MNTGTEAANKIARRIIAKYSLKLPINIESIVGSLAKLVFMKIPLDGVDGVSLNLKTPGKETIVVVNSDTPPLRQRFTIAHELGHIVIPWHIGNIVDHVENGQSKHAEHYYDIETEANMFAGELLMPLEYVSSLLKSECDIAKAHYILAETCLVSLHASAMRLSQVLPENYVYAVVNVNTVEFSGKTEGTIAKILEWSSEFRHDSYDYCEKHYSLLTGTRKIHWWILPSTLNVVESDDYDWRISLDSIINDLGGSEEQQQAFKKSINGVIAYANGKVRQNSNYSINTLVAACVQRLKDRTEFKDFVKHPEFHTFISKKARTLVEKH